MGKILNEIIDTWKDGVVTSAEADAAPGSALTKAYNSELVYEGTGRAILAKRRGCVELNATPVTGATAIIGQYPYKRLASGVVTQYHLLVSYNGRTDWANTSGTLTNIATTGITSGNYFPDLVQANNMVFLANGQQAMKINYSGSALALQYWGITAPSTGPTLADSGSAGSHSGTYEARVTFYNTVTAHESSAGTTSASVTVTNHTINWTDIPISTDSQVNARKLYIRNTGTMTNFYYVATISDNSTTTYTSNVADTALVTLGPDTAENNRPSNDVKYASWHKSRMFAATDSVLYYSKINDPESFDPEYYLMVSKDDGQRITGLLSIHGILLVFKENSVFAIVGDDPEEWYVKQVIKDIGCVAHRSIVVSENVIYWWSEVGPVQWTWDKDVDTPATPVPIGLIYIESDVQAVNSAQWALISGAVDVTNQRVVWSVPGAGQSRCTFMLPFNYRLQRWESNYWDPVDAASMCVVEDANGLPWVMAGGYAGQVFKMTTGDHDGLTSGTSTGTFVAAGTSHATIVITGGAFRTTGGSLTERYVTVVDSNGVFVDRERISSNTADTLTLAASITGLTTGSTYTIYVAGPRFDIETVWSDMTDQFFSGAFVKKRYEFLLADIKTDSTGYNVHIALAFDRNPNYGQVKTITTLGQASTWNASVWTAGSYGTKADRFYRIRVGRTGVQHRVRLWQYIASQPFSIHRLGMRAEVRGVKLG